MQAHLNWKIHDFTRTRILKVSNNVLRRIIDKTSIIAKRKTARGKTNATNPIY